MIKIYVFMLITAKIIDENQINIMRDELNEVKSILSDIKTILEETK